MSGSSSASATHAYAATGNYNISATYAAGAGDVDVFALPGGTAGSVNFVTVNKADQTVSFSTTAPDSATIGGATYTPAATATSSLTVTLGASGACSMTSGVVHFNAVGTCTITADQGGDDNRNAAPQQTQSFSVGKGVTSATVHASANLAAPAQQLTLTATVAVTDTSIKPVGAVAFKDGSTTLGTGNLSNGVATFQTSTLPIGSNSITASYGGNANFLASVSAASVATVEARVGAEFKVNTAGGGAANTKQSPAIARLSDGGFVVVWESSGQDGSGIGVYAQRFRPTGAALSGEFRVNTTTTNDQKQPAVAGLAGGGFVVVWASGQTAAAGLDIHAQRYSSVGGKLGPEVLVNTTTAHDQSMPAIAGLSDGGFVVAWASAQTTSAGLDVYAQRFNEPGVKQGGEFRVNTTATADETQPAVAALASGFVVAWASKQVAAVGFDIYGQRFNGSGAKAGNEFRINTTQPADQTQPQLAKLNDGSFVAVWTSILQDTSGLGVYAQRFSAAGAKLGSEFRVNTTVVRDQSQPSVVAFTDHGFLVVWTSLRQDGSGNGVYGQAFTTAGVKANVEFRLNTTTTSNQSQPHAAAFAAGACTVVWTSSAVTPQAIIGQRFKLGGL